MAENSIPEFQGNKNLKDLARVSQTKQEQEIERERAQRSELLAQISAALANDEALLAQREQDRASLEQLLSEIEAATASLAIPMETQPFSAAQGQMPWPVDGSIRIQGFPCKCPTPL